MRSGVNPRGGSPSYRKQLWSFSTMTAKAQAATQTEEPVNEAPAEAETAKAPATPRS